MTGSSDDNPFVIAPGTRGSNPTRLGPWLRAAALLAICGLGVYGLHALTQKWLLSRLSGNLQAHPPHVQIERLGMLADFGEPALPTIVSALASPDESVSAAAFRLLTDLQGRWQTSAGQDAVGYQETLLGCIDEIADGFPAERRSRVAELVNQIVLDTVGARDNAEADVYRHACDLLATLTEGADGAPRVAMRPAVSSPQPTGQPILLAPLPTATSIRIVSSPTTVVDSAVEDSIPAGAAAGSAADQPANPEPRQIDQDHLPQLAPISRSTFIVTPVEDEQTALSDNPLAAYDTRSVIDFVGSVQPALHTAAEQELRKRNFSDGDMELATRLTSPSAHVRLGMVAELPERSDVDPRMWLIWLANDPERDVRLQAISRLGTMDDPKIREALRQRLQEERDPTVATRLRRFLGLR